MHRFHTLDADRWALPPRELERTLSPALVVHLDIVRHNIETMRRLLDGDLDRWRPHVKTVKIPEVLRLLVRAGVRHFKCATTREAEALLELLDRETDGEGDLLLAYPLLGPALERLGALASRYVGTRISVLCEDLGVAARIPDTIDIFIDVDTGMGRSGVPAEDAARLLALARHAGSRLRGLHSYEGHVRAPDPGERRRQAQRCFERLLVSWETLHSEGLTVEELISSGTPTFLDAMAFAPIHAIGETWHRVSPGIVVYHDARSAALLPEQDFLPAAVVLSRVVSRPSPGRVTLDAGSKALGADAEDPVAVVLGQPGLVPARPTEEHLPVTVESGADPDYGSVLYLAPAHVCTTVNLAECALLLDGGEVLGVAEVSARAHDIR